MSTRASLSGAVFAAFIFAISFCGDAAAEECPPLTLITSVGLVPSEHGTAGFVPVSIQGSPRLMLLDTGGANTEITNEVADELKLPRRHVNIRLYNASGEYSDEAAVATFELGTLKANDEAFLVAPGSNPFGNDARLAGILAPDILRHYDVDVDFGANKLNFLSQQHCEGKVIYWPASAVAVVPMRVLNSGHIIVQVSLDGHSVIAMVDTGASNSTLNLPAAESYFGLKMGSADAPQRGQLPDRTGAFTYEHTFKSLAFEGISVSNPHIIIIPDENGDLMANIPSTGTRLADRKNDDDKADMLIGMDVLRHFHLYIAYKEEKLYITPIEPPAAAADSPSAPSKAGQ